MHSLIRHPLPQRAAVGMKRGCTGVKSHPQQEHSQGSLLPSEGRASRDWSVRLPKMG